MASENYHIPTPLALLVADRVYHDRETGKWVVAGIFSTIGFGSLPRNYEHMEVFFQLTDVSNRPVDLHLRIEHSDGDVVFDMGGPIKANSPLDVIAKRVVLKNMPFKKQGKHWVMLKSGEAILMQVPLFIGIVQRRGQQQKQKPPDDQPQE
jgi:hypothetical protein